MIKLLKKILGFSEGPDLGELIDQGATVVDVRTKQEYASGHVPGSINIPLNMISSQLVS